MLSRPLTCAAASFLLAVAGCGGGSTGPDDDDDDDGDPTTAILTITAKAMDAGYVPGVIYAYTGDNLESRTRMPLLFGENDAIVKPFNASEKTVQLVVPKGKYVTLFVAEFGHYGVNAKPQGQPLSKEPPPDATEFTGWSGNTDRIITSETGVAAIKMDRDATVTAEFRKFTGIAVQSIGCADIKYSYTEPPYLGFGTTQEESGSTATLLHGPTSTDDDWFFVYARQGTNFTFTALHPESRNPNNQTTGFQTWAGAGSTGSCGIALSCTLPVPPRGTNPVVLNVRNSWLSSPQSLNGIGCGVCTSIDGTCNLPFRP